MQGVADLMISKLHPAPFPAPSLTVVLPLPQDDSTFIGCSIDFLEPNERLFS